MWSTAGPRSAVTYDPVHDELFWARRGSGANRNERADPRLRTAPIRSRAVIGSTFTFKMSIEDISASDRRHPARGPRPPAHGLDRADDVPRRRWPPRRLRDRCYCHSWDVIGGLLLVEEAGGVASDFIADNGLLDAGSALACTPGLQQTLEQVRDRATR